MIRPLVAPSKAGRNTDGLNKARPHWAGRCNDWLPRAALNRHALHRAGLNRHGLHRAGLHDAGLHKPVPHRQLERHGAARPCAGVSFALGWNRGLLNSPDSQQACVDHKKLPHPMV